MISIEVDKEKETQSVKGFCKLKSKIITIEPGCRECLRRDEKRIPSKSKKTATQRSRISQGRLREKQKKDSGEDWKVKKTSLDFFNKKN
jgi:hypothetical protein